MEKQFIKIEKDNFVFLMDIKNILNEFENIKFLKNGKTYKLVSVELGNCMIPIKYINNDDEVKTSSQALLNFSDKEIEEATVPKKLNIDFSNKFTILPEGGFITNTNYRNERFLEEDEKKPLSKIVFLQNDKYLTKNIYTFSDIDSAKLYVEVNRNEL